MNYEIQVWKILLNAIKARHYIRSGDAGQISGDLVFREASDSRQGWVTLFARRPEQNSLLQVSENIRHMALYQITRHILPHCPPSKSDALY